MIWLVQVILILATVAGEWMTRTQNSPKLRAATILFALLSIAVGAKIVWRGMHEDFHAPLAPDERTAGFRLGQAVTAAVPAGGKVLIIQTPISLSGQQWFQQSQMEGLHKSLKRDMVGLDDRPELRDAWQEALNGPGMTCKLFTAYLKTYPDAAAVISFVGLPDCPPDQLPDSTPPLYALGFNRDRDNTAWHASPHLKLLIVPRASSTVNVKEDSFDARYQIITGGIPQP